MLHHQDEKHPEANGNGEERRYTNGGEGLGLDGDGLAALRAQVAAWRAGPLADSEKKMPPREARFTTWSGMDVPDVVTPAEKSIPYEKDLGLPGEYPFTRGVQPTMYRSRLWTMRMFAGFGTPEQTNARFKYLLAEGQTGLSTAFDFPTLMGYDSDSPRSLGEVGMCGVAVDTLRDMELLFDGIPLDKVTTSMTINGPAIILLALYIALADKQGVSRKLRGTMQNDCLKEFIAQKEWISPPEPGDADRHRHDRVSARDRVPRWNTISISGYHIREAGATAVAGTGLHPRRRCRLRGGGIERGLDVDEFAPRLSFFFDVHNDFFEEIAKFRAARRMWARIIKERFGAKNREHEAPHPRPDGRRLPTAQQPYNNVVRVASRRWPRSSAARSRSTPTLSTRPTPSRPRTAYDRPAHPADHRRRERRRQHRRPSRRQLLRRGTHRQDRGRGPRVHQAHRRDGRHGLGD